MADKSKATRVLFMIFAEPPREASTRESSPGRKIRKVLRQSDVLNLYLETERVAGVDSSGWRQRREAPEAPGFG